MSVKLASCQFMKRKILQRQHVEEKQPHIASVSGQVEEVETQNNADESVDKPFIRLKRMKTIDELVRLKRFIARKRPKQTHIKINVFSLHGYSSLKMQQDGLKTCASKVRQTVVSITREYELLAGISHLNVTFTHFRLCSSPGWQFVFNFLPQ